MGERLKLSGSEKVLVGILSIMLIGAPLALGSVHYETLSILVIIAVVACILFTTIRFSKGRLRLDLVSLVFTGLLVWGIVSVLPLPPTLAMFLSPRGFDIRAGALKPLGIFDPSAWIPLSMDVSATAAQMMKIFLALVTYQVVFHMSKSYGTSLWARIVALAGGAVAAVMITHQLWHLESVYGFYIPKFVAVVPVPAPFLNVNHLAGSLNLALPVALGLSLDARQNTARLFWLTLVALMGAAIFLTLSRGGIAACIVGQILFIGLLIRSRSWAASWPAWLRGLWLPAGLVFVVAAGLYVAQEKVVQEYMGGNLSKWMLWAEGFSLVDLFPWVGSGMGTFWMVFPQKLTQLPGAGFSFKSVECMPIQALIELGIPLGGAAVLLLAFPVVKRILEGPKKARHVGVVVGLSASALHNLTDFNLDIAGVIIMAAALLGMITGSSSEEMKAGQAKTRMRRWGMISHCAATSLLALAAIPYVLLYNLEKETDDLYQAYQASDISAFHKDHMAALLSRHPADYYLPLLAGIHEYRSGGNPLPWLNRALVLSPHSGQAHLYIARALAAKGNREQALLEYELAIRSNPDWRDTVAREVTGRWPKFSLIRRLADLSPDPGEMLDLLADLLNGMGRTQESAQADKVLFSLQKDRPGYLRREIYRMIGEKKFTDAVRLANTLVRLRPKDPASHILLITALRNGGNIDEAIRIGREAIHIVTDQTPVAMELALSYREAGRNKEALSTAKEIESLSRSQKELANALVFRAGLEEGMGQGGVALGTYHRASIMDPENRPILENMARLALAQGDSGMAIHVYRRLQRLEPQNPIWEHNIISISNDSRYQALTKDAGPK